MRLLLILSVLAVGCASRPQIIRYKEAKLGLFRLPSVDSVNYHCGKVVTKLDNGDLYDSAKHLIVECVRTYRTGWTHIIFSDPKDLVHGLCHFYNPGHPEKCVDTRME